MESLVRNVYVVRAGDGVSLAGSQTRDLHNQVILGIERNRLAIIGPLNHPT
jgi:hypothetical protein